MKNEIVMTNEKDLKLQEIGALLCLIRTRLALIENRVLYKDAADLEQAIKELIRVHSCFKDIV